MRRSFLPPLALLALASLLATSPASAQEPAVPRRQIPASVLVELSELEDRFDLAVTADCAAERCFSKGCTYVAHTVSDRPQAGSLPGLNQDPGPGSVEAQAWLTQASCAFAVEASVEPADVQALARRLQTKVSTGWTVVSVGHQQLPPLPPYVQEPPEPPEPEVPAEPEVVPPAEPPPWTLGSAAYDLWTTLLDDAPWMLGLLLGTGAAMALIWSWRRLGRETIEERALLAELAGGGAGEEPSTEPEAEPTDDAAFVARESAAWRLRFRAERPDPEVQAMVRDLLRAGQLPLLAKAALAFPDLPRSFPIGGDVAQAKLELAEYLKTVDPAALPSDAELFRALNRHALAAALASQRDAEIVRGLREEFGAPGLAALVQAVPPRAGAVLFALAPSEAQREVARLFSPPEAAGLSEQLLRSNRMDPHETTYLFAVLEAARAGDPLPVAPRDADVSDHGAAFDAAGALCVLLPRVAPGALPALFEGALLRFGGSLPAWYAGILLPEMLEALDGEARADLFLSVEAEPVAAWLSLLAPEASERLVATMRGALRASIQAASSFPSRARQVALADRGRMELARGFQAQLARTRTPFEQVVRGLGGGRA